LPSPCVDLELQGESEIRVWRQGRYVSDLKTTFESGSDVKTLDHEYIFVSTHVKNILCVRCE